MKSWLDSLKEDPNFIKTSLMDVKRSSSFISQRLDAVAQRLERDGWEADFSDIREKNKAFTPVLVTRLRDRLCQIKKISLHKSKPNPKSNMRR